MGLKLVDPVDIVGSGTGLRYFTTHPNTILTFQRNIKVDKTSAGYRITGTMRLYTEEIYNIVETPSMSRTHIFEQEVSYDIAPNILDTNLSGFLYSKMMELYPTAIPC
jgi:hypothetical protein